MATHKNHKPGMKKPMMSQSEMDEHMGNKKASKKRGKKRK